MEETLIIPKKKKEPEEILQDESTTDEELNKVIKGVEIFCKVAYELYSEIEQAKDKNEEQNEYKQAA